jgi:AcrR family transcriptional regulator
MSTDRISNADRRAATRAAVLEATIAAIVQFGYTGASVTRIAEISGFTRGAQAHYFKSKANMVGEALLYLQERRSREIVEGLGARATHDTLSQLETIWQTFASDLYVAATELHVAARSDAELREVLIPVEREINQRMRSAMGLVLGADTHPDALLTEVADLILNSMRGMAVQQQLQSSPRRARRQLATLARAVDALLNQDS